MNTDLKIFHFDYTLPDDAVAKYPLPDRDHSRLLVWKEGVIADHRFSQLPGLLPEGSMLVFNNTRVIRARLHFAKSTGAKIEVFCLEPTLPHDYVLSFAATRSCRWKCIVGNLKRWKEEVLEMRITPLEDVDEKTKDVVLRAELVGELEGGVEVEFSWDNPNFNFAEILEAAGNIPIPPYLHRESEEIDSTVYQTVYSKIKGSVAAPTAGLHFTESTFKELTNRNITCEELTLHVGAGTFQPVKSDTIREHRMHTEHFAVSKELIDRMIVHKRKIFAVGTTSVRTLESLFWMGCKILENPQIEPSGLFVKQWEPYDVECADCKSVQARKALQAREALQAISNYLEDRKMSHLETSTQIIILPGYQFRIIDGLVTNFHQPQSTLLLLISAILGTDWRRVYDHALKEGYRFLSYGDANLYFLNKKNADL